MADEVVLRPGNERAKVRRPWGVLGLSVITLGIYTCFWWYFVNREMRDLGRARAADGLGRSPGASTVAFVLGGYLIVPYVWTVVSTTRRVKRAGRLAGHPAPLNGWIAAALWIFTLGILAIVYMQHHLNRAWQTAFESSGRAPEGLAPPAPAPAGPEGGDPAAGAAEPAPRRAG